MEFPFNKALVTGGAGFIGSHIIERLLGMGVEVVCIDDYTTGRIENLADFSRDRLQVVECSVADYDALRRHFDGVDIVFHNAASKSSVIFPYSYVTICVSAVFRPSASEFIPPACDTVSGYGASPMRNLAKSSW